MTGDSINIYYVDGRFVPEDQAMIPVTDLSVLRGYGVCDIIRTYRGKPFFLIEHVHRLVSSAKEIGLSLPWSKDKIIRLILETLDRNSPISEVNIRVVITGGSSPDFFNPQGTPRLLILVTELKDLPSNWYKKGINVITLRQERPIPGAKVTSYIPAALALKKAKSKNAIEAIYVNRSGLVLEGTTSNLFAFSKDTLITAKDNILKGITREVVLKLSSQVFQVQEKKVTLDELLCADEVFISGTNKGIVPVVKVDDTTIGDGRPGVNTRRLMKLLEDHALAY